jgi:tRNA(fMet)-specific endonuclease VapC
MKYLLDTNFCIAVLRGHARAIERLCAVAPDECAVSVVSIYEMQTGVAKCQRPGSEHAKLEQFLVPLTILPFDEDSARHAAIIRADLERSGSIIGPYDLLLAGQALALHLTMITHNTGEFSRVNGLSLADWEK